MRSGDTMARRFSDIYSSILFLILSVFIYIFSLKIKVSTVSSVGPDILPKTVAIGIGLLAIIQLIKSVTKYRREQVLNESPEKEMTLEANTSTESPVSYKTLLATIALVIGYIIFMEKLGFLITNFIYLVLQIYLLSDKNKKKVPLYILISAVVSFSIYYLFRNVFYLLLPSGVFG